MKQKLLSLFLAAVLSLSLVLPASAAGSLPFTDVAQGSWYYTYVKDLYDSGVISGVSATSFDPSRNVSVGESLKLVMLACGIPVQEATRSHWASGYYDYAKAKGWLPSGLSTDLNAPMTRLQIAQVTVNILGISRTGKDSPFSDCGHTAALALYDRGIFVGNANGSSKPAFKPKSPIIRSEISAVIWRLEKAVPSIKKETTPTPSGDYIYFGGRRVYVEPDMPVREYDTSLFQIDENGFMTYDSDKYTYRVGVDVSKYQGSIDWAKVKKAGVEFALIRLGYRGYGSSGNMVIDPYFKEYIKGAQAQGIDVGVYFFSQAITPEEAVEEAKLVVNTLKDYTITYPVAYDWEFESSWENPRTAGLDDSVLTLCAVAFCEEIARNGYAPIVYSNPTYFYLHFDLSQLTSYPLWLAHYVAQTSFYYHFDIWQYTSSGKVPGINGKADLDIHLIPKT